MHEAYYKCPDLIRGECVEDLLSAKSSRLGLRPGCTLDYHGATARVTFVWHATAEKITSTRRTLVELLNNATPSAVVSTGRHRTPSTVILGFGAWDMQIKGRAAATAYKQTLVALDGLFGTTAMLRVAYGNWPCAHKQKNATLQIQALGREHFHPAGGEWPIYNWGSSYFVTTMELRDTFRNYSISRGWTWLDVERTHQTAPAMPGSPCGNQHSFGAIADAHVQILLAAVASRSVTCPQARWR